MSQTAGRETLTELLVRERALAGDRKRAIEAHEQILGELNVPLKKRFGLYCEKFQPLLDQANALGQKIVEIHAEGFGERNIEWGNGGIITLQVDGEFTRIFTKDMFRGDYDEFAVYIPTKYLEEDGERRLLEDAQRLEAELKAARIPLEEADRQKKEDLEYAEFVRLQAKFLGHPSS
ncbi:protein of unknown function [Acidithiobacillus ferrivorans]|uniref:Uncharacterized protein n=1 Tax=Acidithiobacillus ferrivorans TaxID=160808 RepID=A0A060UQ90_9PROT|nr:hypothetical protein [Acidithiobacillus ferrivorans]CDQ10590.1 hypothetical protein AFERRI_400371 [Acidithiobacillus ferrivorans]SMH64621.1 protein of unknown function [Acidithiobacillus ferrivorans]